MSNENQTTEKKSFRALESDKDSLAKACVAFATSAGGILKIGIEDDEELPPPNQIVTDEQLSQLSQRIPELTQNVGVMPPRRVVAANGGQYIELTVLQSRHSIPATADGRYFKRVGDSSRPLRPDDLERLLTDRPSFAWESHVARRVPISRINESKFNAFFERIKQSKRTSEFVRAKSEEELLSHYLMCEDGYLTNLGVLMIGMRDDRARLRYAPSVQVIKYDDRGRKINKWVWDDYRLSPIELIEEIWAKIPDWRESQEIPNGLLRTNIRNYDEEVVRELLANAFVHRPYTQGGDIFINLHPDRLEVHNPGQLPFGVTPENILHKSVKRNEHLAQVFYDLQYMEREGSGFDRMYEVLVSSGKRIPEVRDDNDRVAVTVYKQIVRAETLDFMAKVEGAFDLSQKEIICLGLIAQHERVTAVELTRFLGLTRAKDLRAWLGRLLSWELVSGQGRTKGKEYFVDPELLRKLEFRGTTSLKGIESHRLKELVIQDLEIYRNASIREIQARIGNEIDIKKIRRALDELVDGGKIIRQGAKRWTRYLYFGPDMGDGPGDAR